VRDENVVERRDEADAEVKRDHQRHRKNVASSGSLNRGGGTFSCDSKCHFVPLS